MLSTLRYVAGLLTCIAVASGLSLLAVHAFWIGARCFQSVPVARALDAIGTAFLLPARAMLWSMGGLVDQAPPLFHPEIYAIVNGGLVGMGGYFIGRRLLRIRRAHRARQV